jgi:hypothetical protein
MCTAPGEGCALDAYFANVWRLPSAQLQIGAVLVQAAVGKACLLRPCRFAVHPRAYMVHRPHGDSPARLT